LFNNLKRINLRGTPSYPGPVLGGLGPQAWTLVPQARSIPSLDSNFYNNCIENIFSFPSDRNCDHEKTQHEK